MRLQTAFHVTYTENYPRKRSSEVHPKVFVYNFEDTFRSFPRIKSVSLTSLTNQPIYKELT